MRFAKDCIRREVLNQRESEYLYLPRLLVRFVGVAVGLALVLVAVKLDIQPDLPWWIALSPVFIALCITFIGCTVAIIMWVRVAVLFCTGTVEVDVECEFRLDTFLRTAKICFLSHGYVSLLMVSLGLLLLKLQLWPSLLVLYPLLPLIVLGMAYIFFAVLFKQPEVDSPSFLLVGVSLVAQCIMLVIKLDHMLESKSLPWALTFTPSWFTYVVLLIYCVLSPLQLLRELQATEEEASHSASSADTPYGGAEGQTGVSSAAAHAMLHIQLLKVSGIACWVIGWGLSQVLLTLRLDVFYKVSWISVILPSLVGLILFLIFVTELVSDYLRNIAELLWATLVLVNSPYVDEQVLNSPLIHYRM